MLKLIFWLLLAVNAALFALQQGYLGGLYSDGREPARATKQLQADKIKLMAADRIPAADSAAPAAPTPVAADTAPIACTEIGNFNAAEARKFSSQWAELMPAVKLARRDIQEVASHMVYLPPLGSKEAADKKADDLRQLGITEFFVIQDATPLRYGISLGIFKTEEAAQKQVANLARKGLNGARVGTRSASAHKTAFQLKNLDAPAKAALDKIKADFPAQEMRSCG
ncbi:SPOR domain-containing protein [Paraherbaspirillum soli]|uniref:SPOR domain-containing protein n=1 Tax=Paraherbaspirillum soli TaxID=631222 RepID=A0ABW0M5S1_9BURK